MMNDVDLLKRKLEWTGERGGIALRIVQWFTYPIHEEHKMKGTWNYYLRIPLAQIPDDQQSQFNLPPIKQAFGCGIGYDYMSGNPLADIEWHCGITYYAKEGGHDGFPVVIVAGCDYNHVWDEDTQPCLSMVLRDCHRTIDDLVERVPDLKRRCRYNGKWYAASEGGLTEHGEWWSREGRDDRAARNPEWKVMTLDCDDVAANSS